MVGIGSKIGNGFPQIFGKMSKGKTAQSPETTGSVSSQKPSEASTAMKQEAVANKVKTKNGEALYNSAIDKDAKEEQIGQKHQALPPGKAGENALKLSESMSSTQSSGSEASESSDNKTTKFIQEVTGNVTDKVKMPEHGKNKSEAAANAKKATQTVTLNQAPEPKSSGPVDDPSKGVLEQMGLEKELGGIADNLNKGVGAVQGQMTELETEANKRVGDLNVGGVGVQDVAEPLKAGLGEFTDGLTVSAGVHKDGRDIAARFNIAGTNLGNTGISGKLSGGFSIVNKTEYLEDNRILQVRSEQADISVGVSAEVGIGLPVSGGIGFERTYDVAYAKKAGPGENLISVKEKNPPSRSEIQKNPTILNEGDEIAFRGMLKLSVSAGVVEPHSQVSFAVGGSITNEFVTSISRLEGTPPKFKVHIEPGNRNIDAKATVGWGPFSVTGEAGKASTVHYNFEMSEAAVTTFMETGELPKLPDPKQYLGSLDKLSEKKQGKLLEVFDRVEINGVRLTSMGATKSSEVSLEGSATVAKVKTSSGRSKQVYMREGEILRQDVHTMVESHSAMFKGQKSTSLSLTQGSRQTTDAQKNKKTSYVGLEASFKVGDTKTTQKELTERIENANVLLGPSAPQLHLPEKSDKSWDSSSLEIKANITPVVLAKLTELGGVIKEREAMTPGERESRSLKGSVGNDPEAVMKFMSLNHKVSTTDVTAMLKDMHEISSEPELAGKPEQIKRKQGLRMAAFLASGTTSVVNEEELKRIATVQRLVGPELKVVEVGFSTDVHRNKINSLNLDSYLHEVGRSGLSEVKDKLKSVTGSTPDKRGSWTHFNSGAQKLKALEQVRQDLVGDKNIEPRGKELMLKQVDEYIDALDVELSAQLDDPQGRMKIMEGLLKAEPMLPSDLEVLYKSPEAMYKDPAIREEFMDMVLLASVRDMNANVADSHKEIANLVKSIANSDNGSLGVDGAFKLLNSAKEFDPKFQAKVVNQVGAKTLVKMVPNMTNDQKMKLLGEIAPLAFPESKKSVDDIKDAIIDANKKSKTEFDKIDVKLKGLEKNLHKLKTEQTLLLEPKSGDKYSIKNEKVMSHFKEDYKVLSLPMDKIENEISSSFLKLGEQRHLILSQRTDGLNQDIDGLIGGIDRMSKDQRLGLLTELLKPQSYGSVSSLMLQRLVDSSSSKDNFELTLFAQDINARIVKLESDPPSVLTMSSADQKVMRQELQACLKEIQLSLS